MPNLRFQPLTLSVEEWQRIWTTQVESRDEGVNRIVKLRAECEAQAEANDGIGYLKAQLAQAQQERDQAEATLEEMQKQLEAFEHDEINWSDVKFQRRRST